tara:strand:- start:1358 stop:1495 length:138 start_codon:yes stop_codon:yes gene_type:complete
MGEPKKHVCEIFHADLHLCNPIIKQTKELKCIISIIKKELIDVKK